MSFYTLTLYWKYISVGRLLPTFRSTFFIYPSSSPTLNVYVSHWYRLDGSDKILLTFWLCYFSLFALARFPHLHALPSSRVHYFFLVSLRLITFDLFCISNLQHTYSFSLLKNCADFRSWRNVLEHYLLHQCCAVDHTIYYCVSWQRKRNCYMLLEFKIYIYINFA